MGGLGGTGLLGSVSSRQRKFYPWLRIRFWPKKNGSGALYLKRRENFKVFQANILDNFKPHLFCLHTFGVRDVLDSENQPGSGSGQIRNPGL